jgi:hypothetical protein
MFGGTLFVFCAVIVISEDAAVNTRRKAVERRSSARIPDAHIAAIPARSNAATTQYPNASQVISTPTLS